MLIGLLIIGVGIFVIVGVFKTTGPLIAKVLEIAVVVIVMIVIVGFFIPQLNKTGTTVAPSNEGEVTVDLN